MKPINGGQSALIHMQGRPAPVRTWLVQHPPGVLVPGSTVEVHPTHSIKKFYTVDSFDGYVRQLRAFGYTVQFTSPFTATVVTSPFTANVEAKQ